jgi:DNA-binding CsgD family transcriptional regulator
MGNAMRDGIRELPLADARARASHGYWRGCADAATEPVALLDAQGRVVQACAAFEQAMRPGAAVALAGHPAARRITATDAAQQARIDAAVAQACRAADPAAAALRCTAARFILTVRPTSAATRARYPHAAAAVATIVHPARRPVRSTALWQQAFDLTPVEVELAALLMAGHSVESAAATRDCRPATLRVHLRHMFAKTGVSRQADLLSLFARLG